MHVLLKDTVSSASSNEDQPPGPHLQRIVRSGVSLLRILQVRLRVRESGCERRDTSHPIRTPS